MLFDIIREIIHVNIIKGEDLYLDLYVYMSEVISESELINKILYAYG